MNFIIKLTLLIGIYSISMINATPAPNSCLSSAQVVPSTAIVGQTVTITISVTCNIASDNTLVVDLEVYSTAGSQKYQKYWTNQNLQSPTTTKTYTGNWNIATGTSTGNYIVNIGVFDANWATNYYWNNNAATIVVQNSVTTTPAISNNWNITVVFPLSSTVPLGGRLSIQVMIKSPQTVQTVVDVEIYPLTGSNQNQVFQQYWDNQQLTQGNTYTATTDWYPTAAAGISPGNYVIKVGIFRAGWGSQLVWVDPAATFTVTASNPTTTTFVTTSSSQQSQLRTVTHTIETLNGFHVDSYSWYDSNGLKRTVSLKQQGNGNTGNGGYATQMTYIDPATNQSVTINADDNDSHGGFGYFVSHERYRTFSDGQNSIATRVFNTDDSPLGRGIPSDGQALTGTSSSSAAHRFTTLYYHYGTKTAVTNENQQLSTNTNDFQKYSIPVTITWVFEALTDYPRIDIVVNTSLINGPDLVNFDLRGPYGVMSSIDNGLNGVVTKVMWGDRFHFQTTNQPVTGTSQWTWNQSNTGARYNAIIVGNYEMGLFEPQPFSQSALADNWSSERGTTSANNMCSASGTRLPCGGWPYQSIENNFEGANLNQPTNYQLLAWGSSAFYGSSLTTIYDGSGTEPLNGWPANRQILYSLCLVLGKTTPNGLTKTVAANPSTTACAHATNFQ